MTEVRLEVTRGDFTLDVDLSLEAGTTGLFGPSGCGKTTLLLALAGLIEARGRIVVDGRVLLDGPTSVPVHERRIGVVFQDLRLFPHLAVAGNLAFGARGPVDEVAELLALTELLDRRPAQLSGGQQQRVALGRALVAEPSLLLLDEPLSALDAAHKAEIFPYLRRVTERVPVLYVSHHLGDVLQLTRRLVVMQDGRVLGHGPVDTLLGEEKVLELAHRLGLDNVFEVDDIDVDEAKGLVRARAGGQLLRLPPGPPAGTRAMVAIRPEDILLAVGEVGRTSARNVLDGRIVRFTPVAGRLLGQVDVGFPLSVEITRDAAHELGLQPGSEVKCLIKTTAMRWLPY